MTDIKEGKNFWTLYISYLDQYTSQLVHSRNWLSSLFYLQVKKKTELKKNWKTELNWKKRNTSGVDFIVAIITQLHYD